MAVLSGPVVLASGGGQGAMRWAVLSFQKVSAGDTFDMSTLTAIAPFTTVFTALCVATSNRAETFAVSTAAGTNVTIVGTGISSDAVLLFVAGA